VFAAQDVKKDSTRRLILDLGIEIHVAGKDRDKSIYKSRLQESNPVSKMNNISAFARLELLPIDGSSSFTIE
jgi:hypothetical protein